MKNVFEKLLFVLMPCFIFDTTPVSAQVNTAGMQLVGTQNYYGQTQRLVEPGLTLGQGQTKSITQGQTPKVAPTINSVYAQPMRRVNEIPLYGKNKSTYFYAQPKKDDGIFAGGGLYAFAAFSTGNTMSGMNAEKSVNDDDGNYRGGSNKNDSMGTAEGISLGVGRVMSNTLAVEFMYSSFSGMKYGDYAKIDDVRYELDDEEEEIEIKYVNDNTYEVISGGGISSNFIGLGFRYNLDNVFGMLVGRLKPYFAFQVGMAQNTIKDYTLSDANGYSYGDDDPSGILVDDNDEAIDDDDTADEILSSLAGSEFTFSEKTDGQLMFIGTTTRSLAAGIEAGFTLELEGNLQIDLFYKMNRFGKVKTSGNVLSVYTETETPYYVANVDDEPSGCQSGYVAEGYGEGDYRLCVGDTEELGEVQTMTQRYVESGDLKFQQFGIKLKYMF